MANISVEQAAAIVGVSARRVRGFCESGRLRAERVGKAWIIREQDARAFAAMPRKVGRPAKL